MNQRVLVDAHVHLHPIFDRSAFLAAACSHARRTGAAFPWLLFTEAAPDFAFRALRTSAPDGWTVDAHADGCTLTLRHANHGPVMVTAGRQVQTAEGLELLTLGLDEPIEDGTGMTQALAAALDKGALCAVPWGFGKWSGRRGRILAELLDGSQSHRLFLGDNGGRPWFWPEPEPFRKVAAAGRRVLPGSDPLPFKSHEGRAGSYGLLLDVAIDSDRPFAALAAALAAPGTAAVSAGTRAGSVAFCRDQLAMQVVKRARR